MNAADRTKDRPGPLADFMAGVRRSVPVVLPSLPFGLLFGTVSVQNGLTVTEATMMSVAVFAGASQLVGIEMFGQKIAPWMIVLSIFAVNFRHVLYSAALGRQFGRWSRLQQAVGFFFLTDAQYADSERKALEGPLTFAWYMGFALFLYANWVAGTVIGAAFGNLIPDSHALGLDFLLVIYFFGMVMGFRKRPLWLPVVGASALASTAAFYLIGSPWHVSVGAVVGVALAAILTPGRRSAAR
jgi:4-azaleucine resistance transporter AzlC